MALQNKKTIGGGTKKKIILETTGGIREWRIFNVEIHK